MAKAPRSLAGKIVAITGGARGIGRATASALIAQGARVAIGDIDVPLVEQTAAELGSGTIGLPLDVTDRASFERFLTEVEERMGPLDALINNAGIMPIGPFVAETDATAERMIDINLKGVILGSKLALQRFVPRGRGHLVNVASVAGKAGFPGGATYCATKHAVVGLSEAIRTEVRKTDVDVSIIMPVVVNTELGSGLQKSRGVRVVEPDEVAQAIVRALQTGRVNVFVPSTVAALFRLMHLVPRSLADLITVALKGDQVLVNPDEIVRAAYVKRTGDPAPLPPAAAMKGVDDAPAEESPEPETQPV